MFTQKQGSLKLKEICMSNMYDIVVIGGGPGGTPAAMRLASLGKKVLLVEGTGKLGGACLFVGCIPSKIIRHWADVFTEERTALDKAVWTKPDRDEAWNKIRKQIDGILSKRSGAAKMATEQIPTLDVISGIARFISDYEIEVEGRRYTFTNAIIATGAKSFIPPFKGNGVKEVLTSEVFFSLKKLPQSLLIVGGGPIGVEFSQMLTKLGVKCTIVEMMDSIIYGVAEPEFISIITDTLTQAGVEIYTSSKVEEINKIDDVFKVTFTDNKGNQQNENYENVLVVTGKIPNIDDLNLEATSVTSGRKGIVTDKYLKTAAEGIYATGDVIPGPKFAHTSSYEAGVAAANILAGNKQSVNYDKNSWVLFSEPEIASAGLTESQAIERGINVITGSYNYMIDAAAQVMDSPFGTLKFVVNEDTLEVIGVHILDADASMIVGESALIVANKLTLNAIAQTIHPHPTLTEAFGVLAQTMLSKIKR